MALTTTQKPFEPRSYFLTHSSLQKLKQFHTILLYTITSYHYTLHDENEVFLGPLAARKLENAHCGSQHWTW